jgi:hypothetical protein
VKVSVKGLTCSVGSSSKKIFSPAFNFFLGVPTGQRVCQLVSEIWSDQPVNEMNFSGTPKGFSSNQLVNEFANRSTRVPRFLGEALTHSFNQSCTWSYSSGEGSR